MRGQKESIRRLCGGLELELEFYHKAPLEIDVGCFGSVSYTHLLFVEEGTLRPAGIGQLAAYLKSKGIGKVTVAAL